MARIIQEIDQVVNFYSPDRIEQIARETGFVQRVKAWWHGAPVAEKYLHNPGTQL